jgi:ATP-binding cassette subfamily B protein/subfamily B ATP-binding cassette protein MsbA
MRWVGSLDVMAQQKQHAKDRGRVARRLLGELKPWSGAVATGLVFVAIDSVCQALGPAIVSRAIDGDITHGNGSGLAQHVALLLAVWAMSALSQRGTTRRIGMTGQRILASLRRRLFEQLHSLPLSYFDKRPIGDLMSRLLSDVGTLDQLLSQGVTQLLGAVLRLSGVIVGMLIMNWRLALVCYTIIPAMLLTTAFFATRARAAFRKTRQTVGDVTADLQEEIVGVRQAQAFNRTDVNIQKFRQRNAANRDANVSAVGVTSAFSPTIDFLSTIAMALVIGYGGSLALHNNLTVGQMAAFLIYVQQFFRPIQLAASVYTLAQSALAGAERIYVILDENTEPADAPDAHPLERAAGKIVFDRVSFAYDPARPVLHEVSFTLPAGQTMALVGRTGAGKTTIAALIPRFYDATAGSVQLDDIDIQKLKRSDLRAQMAMVLQEPFLFSGSIADNIAYGRPTATRAEIETAARTVDAHDFITQLQKGYDSVLGEGGGTLSQGQRQLIAFARAVLADPRVLILDEATANIDTRTEQTIQRALAILMKGRTSVVIAHRLSTIRNADLILVVDAGRIVERGTHAALLEQQGLYAELYRRQFRDATPRIEKANQVEA